MKFRKLTADECEALSESQKEAYGTMLCAYESKPPDEDDYPVITPRLLRDREKRSVSIHELPAVFVHHINEREMAMRELGRAEAIVIEKLTPRETLALKMYKEHGTFRGAANAMGISHHTAKRLIESIEGRIKRQAGKYWQWWRVYLAEVNKDYFN